MNFLPRDQIILEMTGTLKTMIDAYRIKEVGIFEEEGEEDSYYVGYTVRNQDQEYMIHRAFTKNDLGELAPNQLEWVVETEDEDFHHFQSINKVFTAITQGQIP